MGKTPGWFYSTHHERKRRMRMRRGGGRGQDRKEKGEEVSNAPYQLPKRNLSGKTSRNLEVTPPLTDFWPSILFLYIIHKRAESSTSIATLFNPDKYGLIPQVVVLQGAAGIGKTIMTKKIIFDWASQVLYQDKFNYAFYISSREINLHAESQKTSIVEIISNEWLKCHEVNNVIRNILKDEEKLLFIIDGFDELRYYLDLSENYFCIDPWKKEPVRILLRSLFQKKLLPKSSLIITTRPMALEKLHQCLEHPRNFEILGFSMQERKEYFYKFFENENQAMKAFRFVKQNDVLFTMCVIPLVSWIICTVMKQEMERGQDLQKTPCTLTAIYILYFSSLLKFHHKESKRDVQTNVKGLCALAAEGVLKQQIMFMKEEVRKHNLDQGDSLPLFLNQNLFKRDIDCIQTYSFIHLSFQEFFAALFYIRDEREKQHSQIQNKKLQTLLESHQPFRRDFAVGFRFLFGFLNEEKRMRQLKKEFGWEICPKNKVFLLKWVRYKIQQRIDSHWQKEMLTYLYETQDDNFVKNALCGITKIVLQCNSDMDLMILAYCVQHCQNLDYLSITIPTFPHQEEGELFLSETHMFSRHEVKLSPSPKIWAYLKHVKWGGISGGKLAVRSGPQAAMPHHQPLLTANHGGAQRAPYPSQAPLLQTRVWCWLQARSAGRQRCGCWPRRWRGTLHHRTFVGCCCRFLCRRSFPFCPHRGLYRVQSAAIVQDAEAGVPAGPGLQQRRLAGIGSSPRSAMFSC
uniref:NACHT domain-containing protein n=1 Tax=Naja naja TaxID=35670 RepID=A0A8C6VCN6_NAJNA